MLECAVLGLLRKKADGVADDAVALLEAVYVGADGDDSAGGVTAQHGRPLLDQPAVVAYFPVDGVDGEGGILDQNLVRADLGHVGWAYTEVEADSIEPRSAVCHDRLL